MEHDSTYFEVYLTSAERDYILNHLTNSEYNGNHLHIDSDCLETIIFSDETTLKINKDNKKGILYINNDYFNDFINLLKSLCETNITRFLETDLYFSINNNLQ